MEINTDCMTNISGLHAVGEAAGGIHGVCQMSGNVATQVAVSGFVAVKAIQSEKEPHLKEYCPVYLKITPEYGKRKHQSQEK